MTREEAIAELNVLHERLSNPKDCEDGCYSWEDGWYVEAIDMAIEALQANAVQGEWIEVEDYNGDVHYKCDQCGEEWTFPYGSPKENNANYCPNCGARKKAR